MHGRLSYTLCELRLLLFNTECEIRRIKTISELLFSTGSEFGSYSASEAGKSKLSEVNLIHIVNVIIANTSTVNFVSTVTFYIEMSNGFLATKTGRLILLVERSWTLSPLATCLLYCLTVSVHSRMSPRGTDSVECGQTPSIYRPIHAERSRPIYNLEFLYFDGFGYMYGGRLVDCTPHTTSRPIRLLPIFDDTKKSPCKQFWRDFSSDFDECAKDGLE